VPIRQRASGEFVADLSPITAVRVDIQHFVISKMVPDDKAVLDDFNEGLASMTADGTLKAIMTNYGT